MNKDEWEFFLKEKAVPLHLENNYILSVQKKDKCWFLEKGAVNIFYLTKLDKETLGHRTLLAHFNAPALLFPWDLPVENALFEIAAICEGEVFIYELNLADLQSQDFAKYLQKRILTLSNFFQKDLPEDHLKFLQEDIKIQIPAKTVFQSRRPLNHDDKSKIYWVHFLEGEAHFLGMKELLFQKGSIFPFTHTVFAETTKNCTLEVMSTHDLIEKKLWLDGLKLFNHLFMLYLTNITKESLKEEKKRVIQKKEQEELELTQIFTEMASLLQPVKVIVSSHSFNPIFHACLRIGKEMNLSFRYPEVTFQQETVENTISAICTNSNLRYRKVRLREGWWKKDSGHMLAFMKQEHKPVSIINISPGSYEVDDPITSKRTRVSSEIAHLIDSHAYTFYHPFPDEVCSGKELMQFCSKRYKREYLLILAYGGIASLISLIPPFVAAMLYSTVIPDANLSLLYQLVFLLALSAISAALFTFFRSWIIVRLEGRASNDIQSSFWDRLLKLPAFFFRGYSSGDLFYRLSTIEDIRVLLSTRGARIILSGIFSFFYFIAMTIYSFKLTIVAFIMVIAVSLFTYFISVFKVKKEKVIMTLTTKINGILTQILGGIAKLRIAGRESGAFSYWAGFFTKKKKLEIEAQRLLNAMIVINTILPFLSIGFIFYLSIGLEKKGELFTWAFLAFNAAFIPFSMALFDLSNTLLEMTPIISLWSKAKIILEEPEEVTTKKMNPGKLKGDVSIDRIVFEYARHHPILRDVSLHFYPGEFVGIVGPAGCGKSTLLRLLLGFEKPISGAIYYDGKDLNTLNANEVRKQLGVVLQGVGLIAGSLYENIVCGGIFSKEDILRAIHLSGFEKELDSFPMGLNTVVTSGGETLSGGQKQRLLIARALVSRPKILLFDEATSALDGKSQDSVSHYLEELEVTRIVIAHRLSTLKNADKIYVIDQGKIIQQGSFQVLSNEQGLFKEMLIRQML